MALSEKKNSATRKLIKWLETKPDTETRREFISRVSTMNMTRRLNPRLEKRIVQFDDITRFAGEMWLSDGPCGGFRLSRLPNVKDRERMLDTSQCVLSKAVDSRIVLVPVHITVDIQHWCAAIVDFGSKIIWIYVPRPGTTILMQ
ncbi:hypothetical protein GQ600_8409 [Phytophthora cactorum]|nr:hypothetical protein GQ600_8409 [Phytophthora cactorum]